MARRFSDNGLTLFTEPDGTLPVNTPPPAQNGYVGFANSIQVNPAVQTNPSMVRDGDAATSIRRGPASPTSSTLC